MIECSQEGFGRVEIDSDYNLGYIVDMGQDSAVDIDDEEFRLEGTSWAEMGYWRCCGMGGDY
jgi:hypothetical protein